MLQWLRLLVSLLLCALVCGKELQCNEVDYNYGCWNSNARHLVHCARCVIKDQQITEADREITINPRFVNGTAANVESVVFFGGNLTRLPTITNKVLNKKIQNVFIVRTNTEVLNKEFFENAGHLKYFKSFYNEFSVDVDTFKGCENLEALYLSDNRITSIAQNAFDGLDKLVLLNLATNKLTQVLPEWFTSLGNLEELSLNGNQLDDLPDDSIASLTKLKHLLLAGNKIVTIRRGMFVKNLELQSIALYHNRIKLIQAGSFDHLKKLTAIELKGNNCLDTDFKNKTSAEIVELLGPCYPETCPIPTIVNGHVAGTKDNSAITTIKATESVRIVCDPTFVTLQNETGNVNTCLQDSWMTQEWPKCHRELFYIHL